MVKRHSSQMPAILNRETDIKIPRRAWSAWKEDGKPRQLRGPLSADDRQALIVRKMELEPWIDGYHETELDEVALALLDMFSGFPSMRQAGDEAAARVDSIRRLLVPHPAWAIMRACEKIRNIGYVDSEGRIERHWPPSDPEIISMVKAESRLYCETYDTAVALLEATVEE